MTMGGGGEDGGMRGRWARKREGSLTEGGGRAKMEEQRGGAQCGEGSEEGRKWGRKGK